MGTYWLDKARYADGDGYEKDNVRPNAWVWRDWVIDAVNRDVRTTSFLSNNSQGTCYQAPGSPRN